MTLAQNDETIGTVSHHSGYNLQLTSICQGARCQCVVLSMNCSERTCDQVYAIVDLVLLLSNDYLDCYTLAETSFWVYLVS